MRDNTTDKKLGLLKASQAKKEAVLSRAFEALQQMKNDGVPINFQSLARFAKVSKVWLYKQPELCEQIRGLRDQSEIIKRSKEIHLLVKNKDEEIKQLKLKLQQKNDRIKQLNKQLEIVYGELHKQNKDH